MFTGKIEDNILKLDAGGITASITYDEKKDILRVTVLGKQTEYERTTKDEYEKYMKKNKK